jgi:hypothetical protein
LRAWIHAKANFQTSGSVRPFVVFGPGLGFRTSAKFKVEGLGEDDLEDEVAATEFSSIFGGGGDGQQLHRRSGYDLGLNDLAEDEPGFDPQSAKSRTFTILFGYGFTR